ncbi:unnamed protein product [Clonostachys rhizophaga]|uniref:DUF7707 domain-containing protein n=1 Tax=Clonostachys rhizophaga TaxID=160324 RepID=A0A9N9YIS9_9HYPO|nr:unnamed protein product [Clonostachys rhizophaga]
MRSYAVLVAAFAVAANAANYTSSLNMTIVPNSVDDSTRASWCTAQGNTCKSLCSGRTSKNDCDYTTLVYDCACSANNSAPGLEYYTQTMPTFICDTLLAQCYKQYENNQDGQQSCKDDIGSLCASQAPPTSSNSGSSSTTTSASSTASQSATQTTQAAASATSDQGGFAAATAIPKHAAAALAAGALFALL